jgi:hypothetical protein
MVPQLRTKHGTHTIDLAFIRNEPSPVNPDFKPQASYSASQSEDDAEASQLK